MINTKLCADPECTNTFKAYNSLQKYCSYPCAAKHEKPINKVSEKQKRLDKLYLKLRKAFLNKKENKFCAVYPKELATEVHHTAGRIGDLYLFVPYWLAVSSDGHKWIHNNPKKAYKKGFLIKSTTA